jgi:photosystem II stability/assembly factor-like uncharacterized protein
MKHIVTAIAIFVLALLSCRKDNDANPAPGTNGYKIEITKGNNQADTLGKLLQDTIIVKVTKGDTLLKNVYVQFETSGCDVNSITEVQVFKPGTAAYRWRLNGTTGKQPLKIVLLDSLRARVDSVVAEATGIMPVRGWFHASCTPNGDPNANSFCKLSSGRLIAAFNTFDYPYYSDDNAITWHPLTTFPKGSSYMTIKKLIATSSDEIFAATENHGLYYSSNGGQTWTIRAAGITDPRYFVDMNYTRSGKLIYTTYFGGVYLSEDKGANWQPVMTGLAFNDRFYYPSEQLNGDLYVVNDVGDVFKSTNKGKEWTQVKLAFTYNVQSLYIDKNGIMYAGVNNNYAELYRSADNGVTWTKMYAATPLPGVYIEIHSINQESNGAYYFYAYGHGLISTTDFVSFTNESHYYTNQSRCYITNKNGHLVIATQFQGVYYNLP